MENFTIRPFSIAQQYEVSDLIKTVFDEFVAPDYSSRGNDFFYDFIKPDVIADRFRKGNIQLVAINGKSILGFIEIRDTYHICLLFVDKLFHGKGIARQLFTEGLAQCRKKNINLTYMEVNASPFSEKIYEKLGFKKVDELQEINGIQFVSMKYDIRNNPS